MKLPKTFDFCRPPKTIMSYCFMKSISAFPENGISIESNQPSIEEEMQKISAENISSIHATWASLRYGHPVAMGDLPPSEPEAPAETGPEISEATERPQLLRKVAQLTKVVMHLTAKNTQSEEQYEEMEKELEEEVSLGLGLFRKCNGFLQQEKRG